MAKGIIYVATSEIEGLVKIGCTQNLPNRMKELSTAGYMRQKCDIVYAIEVENYEEKESLLHKIFAKSRAGKSEFFAEDVELIISTMSAFDGVQKYPEDLTKKESFEIATSVVQSSLLPNGLYYLDTMAKGFHATATMEMKDGIMTVKAGAAIAPVSTIPVKGWNAKRNELSLDGNVLLEDFIADSPSMAAAIITGHNQNGWTIWKTKDGKPIDCFRKTNDEE